MFLPICEPSGFRLSSQLPICDSSGIRGCLWYIVLFPQFNGDGIGHATVNQEVIGCVKIIGQFQINMVKAPLKFREITEGGFAGLPVMDHNCGIWRLCGYLKSSFYQSGEYRRTLLLKGNQNEGK